MSVVTIVASIFSASAAALRPVAEAMPRISTPAHRPQVRQVLREHVVAEPDERDADRAVLAGPRMDLERRLRAPAPRRCTGSARRAPPSVPLLDRVERGLHVVEVVHATDERLE